MVDEQRIDRLLVGIETHTAFLAGYADRPIDGIVTDEQMLSAIKYRFVTAIEGCAKVAHHIGAAQGWPPAESNGHAIRMLADHGVLPRGLAASIADAVGFRNVLVHEYADVDDRQAVSHLDRLDDLRAFATVVARWLDANSD